MIIKELQIKGLYEITLQPWSDHRGFFMRTYDKELFRQYGIDREWLHENHSLSLLKGTVRGMHMQMPPFQETKLVRCVRGAIFDVAVDMRPDSGTFGKWVSVELSSENFKMFYIPRGFAHGFCSLTDNCEVIYKVDNVYSREHEKVILWNDKDLDINWPVIDPVLSEKDRNNISFSQYRVI